MERLGRPGHQTDFRDIKFVNLADVWISLLGYGCCVVNNADEERDVTIIRYRRLGADKRTTKNEQHWISEALYCKKILFAPS